MVFNRSDIRISASPKKVILKYLNFGDTATTPRIQNQVNRILSLDEENIEQLYAEVEKEFKHRHVNFEQIIGAHFEKIQEIVPNKIDISSIRKKLLGAYFSMEYSIRSAALFNPSMVVHPNQAGLSAGEIRFIMSLRAVGEGHISSIEFISGIIQQNGEVILDIDTGLAEVARQDALKEFSKYKLVRRTSVLVDFDQSIFDEFEDRFTKEEGLRILTTVMSNYDSKTLNLFYKILDSNYDVITRKDSPLSGRVIFPSAKAESNGMEDVRFVVFLENGQSTHIGTYTAYDGHKISPQLIITEDFIRFKIRTMYGEAVNDKGFALFPEKINGQFAMIGRQGGVSITIMYSDDLFIWENYIPIMSPEDDWGLVQIGNCGSPIKTDEGWLLMTHLVGPMRKYTISAILLDLIDPSKIIKKLNVPLISPNEDEREGYVPNVVYSCGAMKHGDNLIIPYAMSDSSSTVGSVNIQELLDEMVNYEVKKIVQ